MKPRGLGKSLRTLACAGGVHHAGRILHREKLLIVMYHGVTADPGVARRWWHHVHVAEFARQVQYLKTHYDVLPVDEALTALWTGGLDRPTACITFDDGYLNNRTHAYPVLEKLEAPATIYVATGMIGTCRRLWTVELDHAFTATTAAEVDLSVLGLGRATLGGPAHRVLFRRVLNTVKDVAHQDRGRVLASIYDQLRAPDDASSFEPFRMMEWDDVRALSHSGLITIGGHTVNHEIVSRLANDDVHREIVDSIHSVEHHCRDVSRTFAYPNGEPDDFDDRAIATLRSAGCIGAVTTIEDLCERDSHPFRLERIGVGSDTSFDQFRLLTGGVVSVIKRWTGRAVRPDEQ